MSTESGIPMGLDEERVETDKLTADGALRLDYTMRPDTPHNPLRYDFRWVRVASEKYEVVAGPFVTSESAYRWQEGYDYAAATPYRTYEPVT